ncbi:MAG: sigma-54-dependent Fis family transcriptional regulator [Mesorhizobium sp.]|uniref:GAF domain-containing protein n=1 Tax=Mesorhizobium TaxID=68287 RepID=UPI000FE4FA58|nr:MULTISPECIES: helix-turn-helix domain-containing protein [Mesorhizobium]MCF6120619.1 GAF domain-containing protein [Mesorhizobium muleiense]RWO86730.1 MAG: sigma-54-dependent Fis family transcriptional regulator [Mesorhizobium sp.]RWP41004.1 MAG: sigma-54-dependent Fis family transcriptional regulator [Mesorhizobium sp.]RWP63046.1 MAG: sigma-54-dependent Fis family transcriptional regulator [Mesorhizobium sp.]RWQ50686.1 MAG: sigma-54-dependent Fis family transcriptional regulator [Mesorhizo
MSGQPAHHADVVQAAIATSDAARSALIASWRRSLTLHGLDPAERKAPRRLTEGELRQARQRMEPLLRAADASLDRLYLAVGGIGCCVMLADRDGIPIERRGASADDDTFDEWGLWTGTVWSEDSEGTNGIGTCLADQRPLTIHRDQHFFSRNTLLSCTTAPVYDHEGKLTAALDVSSCRSDLTEDFVNLISVAVGDAARRIEADNFRRAFSNARILLAPATECGASTLLAVDADDLVVGATRSARLALGITQQGLTKGLPAADILGDSANAAEELGEAERGVIQRAITRADGNVSAAAQTLGISRATLHRKLARFGIRRPH